MAHFAELDANNVVLRVIVIGNPDTTDVDGIEKEHIGVAFCQNTFGGGPWKQTSYNHNFRKRYAGIGYTYNEELDAFIAPQPFPSWTFNNETADWDPPTPRPEDGKLYFWDEQNLVWNSLDT